MTDETNLLFLRLIVYVIFSQEASFCVVYVKFSKKSFTNCRKYSIIYRSMAFCVYLKNILEVSLCKKTKM